MRVVSATLEQSGMDLGDIERRAERFAAEGPAGERLDFSIDSLAAIDAWLDTARARRGARAADWVAGAGCYVGEVIRRHVGGRWRERAAPATRRGGWWRLGGRDDFNPVLDLDRLIITPVDKVRARLGDAGEDTIERYYDAVERMVIPRIEDLA
jgi:hypothetical protein